jgi:hypothetical protein
MEEFLTDELILFMWDGFMFTLINVSDVKNCDICKYGYGL